MIRFDRLEREQDALAAQFKNAEPFSYVVIDDFCEPDAIADLLAAIPTPEEGNINKSRDYVFAKNKFEKSNFREIGPQFEEIYGDLMSDRFKTVLQKIVAAPVWVDPEFHGGGIHQGGEGSFLDMHVAAVVDRDGGGHALEIAPSKTAKRPIRVVQQAMLLPVGRHAIAVEGRSIGEGAPAAAAVVRCAGDDSELGRAVVPTGPHWTAMRFVFGIPAQECPIQKLVIEALPNFAQGGGSPALIDSFTVK